jgi:succinyl-diaminopimelate desuccinylase
VIYRAVDWITRLESFALPDARHPLLGGPTMCVTTIHGGLNINSVPDSVTFTIDFRSIPSNSHEDCRKAIRTTLGGKAEITTVASKSDGASESTREKILRHILPDQQLASAKKDDAHQAI